MFIAPDKVSSKSIILDIFWKFNLFSGGNFIIDIFQKVSGTLRALGYTEKELQENLQIGKQRAKAFLTGKGREPNCQEYRAICNMLGIDANFFYQKGKQVS